MVRKTNLSSRAQRILNRRKTPLPVPQRRPRIDQLDPTRTLTLRKAFIAKLRRRFALLKGSIVKYVEVQDSFGLTTNAEHPRDELGRFVSLHEVVDSLNHVEGYDPDTVEHGFEVEFSTSTEGNRYVAAPYDVAKVQSALYAAKVKTIPLEGLTATQGGVSRSKLHSKVDDPLNDYRAIEIVKVEDKRYIHDGTHAATLAKLSGKDQIRARTVEIKDGDVISNSNPEGHNQYTGKGTTSIDLTHSAIKARLDAKKQSLEAIKADDATSNAVMEWGGRPMYSDQAYEDYYDIDSETSGQQLELRSHFKNDSFGFTEEGMNRAARLHGEVAANKEKVADFFAQLGDKKLQREFIKSAQAHYAAQYAHERAIDTTVNSLGIPRSEMPQIRKEVFKEFLQYLRTNGVSIKAGTAPADTLTPTQDEFNQDRVDALDDSALKLPILISRDSYILDGTHRWVKHHQRDEKGSVSILRIDLDVTDALDMMRSFNGVQYAANTVHQFLSDADKLEAFQRRLDQQIDDTLLGKDQEQLWHQFIKQGFVKGASRSYEDVHPKPVGPNRTRPSSTKGKTRKARTDLQSYIKGYSQDQSTADFYQGSKQEFLRSAFGQPVAKEKLDLLGSRSFDELEGMTDDMANKLSRTLADGLTAGKSPHDVADDMTDVLDISQARAETIARTELIRAHAEGQLLALEGLGVEELGVAVEWSNSGLNTVDKKGRPISPCRRCKALSGVVLKLEEAHGLIPLHPNCMCAFVPAGVSESSTPTGQLITKEEIDAAFAEAEVEPAPEIDEERPMSILKEDTDKVSNELFTVNHADTDVLAVSRAIEAEQLLDSVFPTANWCNQYGGDTCKEGSKGAQAMAAKEVEKAKQVIIKGLKQQKGLTDDKREKLIAKVEKMSGKSVQDIRAKAQKVMDEGRAAGKTASSKKAADSAKKEDGDKTTGAPCKQGQKASTTGCTPKGKGKKETTDERSDGAGRARDAGSPPQGKGQVAAKAGRSSDATADKARSGGSQPISQGAGQVVSTSKLAPSTPATKEEVNKRLDKYEQFFRSKGHHEAAEWMSKLRDHVEKVGTEEALKSLGEEVKGKGGGDRVQYAGHADMRDFASAYLDRAGISLVGSHVPTGKEKVISSVAPSSDKEGTASRGKASDVFPKLQGLKDKLHEAQHLPGLEKSEDLSVIMGHERGSGKTEKFTPEVVDKLNQRFGKDQWIVKSYGDEAFAGFGIYFPQRAEQIHKEAQNTIWSAGEQLSKYNFSLHRDEKDNVVGVRHENGAVYKFGTKRYEDTINGDVRRWGDHAANAAPHEKGTSLPKGEDGKTVKMMAQPAFPVVGVSNEDRAAGRTHEGTGEGRVHVITRNGKAEAVPHSTWIKGEHVPVVFESDNTRSMAKAAVDAINALPLSERQGQLYAPDVVKTKDGHKVVEANPSNEAGGSGYLGDNPLIVDSYVSHLTNREPAHVQFIRKLLTSRKSGVNNSEVWYDEEYATLIGNVLDDIASVYNTNPEGHNQYTVPGHYTKEAPLYAGGKEHVAGDKISHELYQGLSKVAKQRFGAEAGTTSTPIKSATSPPSTPSSQGSSSVHAQHVLDAVTDHGGQMVSLIRVRKHLESKGVKDREQQDAAIQHARGKTVTGSNLEGRFGITEEESSASLRESDNPTAGKIGYLSIKV